MSWFQSANLATFAKSALKEAQKTIDKALDINEQEDAASGRGQTGVSAVTDMASEFFASWGVGAGGTSGRSSPTTDKKPFSSMGTADASGGSASSSVSNSPSKNRAISTPPKRMPAPAPTLADSVDIDSSSYCNSRNPSLTSDVPVTLLASSSTVEEDEHRTSNQNHLHHDENEKSVFSSHFTKQHTRSLSDTVFHAPDDDASGSDLVQVLDDSGDHPVENSINLFDSLSQSSPRVTETWTLEQSTVTSTSRGHCDPVNSTVSAPTTTTTSQPEAKSNLELLQEIDLDARPDEDAEGTDVPETNNVIHSSSSDTLTVVESSGLSDGWDWTSPTESCLASSSGQDRLEDENTKTNTPVPISVGSTQENEAKDETRPSQGEETESQNQPSSANPSEIETTSTSAAGEDEEQLSVPVPSFLSHLPSPTTSLKLAPSSSSSRPTSPGLHADIGECTPPSSARVSPNFEMVSSCVVTSSGTQPESSRSSSIVVVSGRDSTPNSRGTSGAGSSGSSEGGHDLVDGEILHSPSAKVVPSSEDYPRVSKHKKAASNSSSSDIEVIPSDYSSSSSTAPHPHLPTTSKSEKTISLMLIDMASQTEFQKHQRSCKVQTDLMEEPKPAALNQKDLSDLVSAEVADILAEKEQEAQQLREEGEKLSVKQFELSQVIKKLRTKEKETEGVIKGLRTEMATKNLELEKLMKTFISKEGIEQSQNDTISKLNQERRKLELRVEQLTSDLEDANDNVESMKATVENASIEILELKNVISSVQRESAEVDRLTRDKAELISRTESLQKEVDHLRSALNSSQSNHQSHEADLKSQISSLTQKIHHLETSLGDISSEVADATMPLSMEIEKLQAELKQQLTQSDRREHTLHSTITDMEVKLKISSEREKTAKDLQIQFQSQHSTLDLRIEELEAQNRNLVEQLQQKEEIFVKKVEDKAARCQKLEKTVERLTGEVERLSSENDTLGNELKAERTSLEIERRRLVDATSSVNNNSQQHRQFQSHHQRSSSMSTTASSIGGGQNSQSRTIRNDNSPRSREHSPSEHSITSEEASYLDEVFDPTTGMMVGASLNGNRSMTPKSFFESFSSAGFIENLQTQLRLRESELSAFQEQLSKNEKIRKQLNEEIANLTMQNQQLALDMEKMAELEQKLQELDKNYNAVLQMYGEKVEEADELRMDLEDVKEMYKAQIEQLLKKS